MALGTAAAVGAVTMAGIAAGMIGPAAIDGARSFLRSVVARARMRAHDPDEKATPAATLSALTETLAQGGVPALSRLSSGAFRIKAIRQIANEISEFAISRGLGATPEGILQTSMLLAAVGLLLSWVLTGSLLIALVLVLSVFAIACGKAVVSNRERRRRVEDLLPDALRALGVFYSSGLGFLQALEQVAMETPDPLGKMFGEVVAGMKAGKTLPEALISLSDSGHGSLAFLSVALEIQQRTGGALQPILDNVATSVSESLELRRSLEVKTAQARMSARIVSVMPVAMFGAIALMSPSAVAGFFSSPVGLMLFIVACAMEVSGILIIRRILDVDVGDSR